MDLINYKDYIDIQLTNNIKEKHISKWLPFVGKDYHRAPEKILVVGLSHYYKGNNLKWLDTLNTEFPNIVSISENGMGMYNENIPKQRMCRGLERCFFNVSSPQVYNKEFKANRMRFWKSIAFHQFLETPMKTTKHDRAIETQESIDSNPYKRLIALVNVLKPDHIVMLSNSYNYHEALKKIENVNEEIESRNYIGIVKNKSDIRTCKFKINGHSCTISAILHPSRYRHIYFQHQLLTAAMPKFINYIQDK